MASNRLQFKPHDKQVMVITGATSGVGLALAREAAKRGTSLFLIARNAQALEEVARELADKGARVAYHAADVGVEAEVRAAAYEAMKVFGGWDVWVNDAGVSIFGPVRETPLEDHRRLFDTNYWGVVHGSLVAVEHLRKRPGGGVLINVGSVLGDTAIPIQGAYAASKSAVKGFTEALRMELLREDAPVVVTLIKPSSIATPYKDHAKNLTESAVKNPGPVYDAKLVAEAILHSSRNRVRELTVGFAGKALTAFHSAAPGVAEPLLAKLMPAMQRDSKAPRRRTEDSLYEASQDLAERSDYRRVRGRSYFTMAQMHPMAVVGGALGLGAVAGLIGLLTHKPPRQLVKALPNVRSLPQPLAHALPFRRRRAIGAPVFTLTGGVAALAAAAAAGAALWVRRMRRHKLNGQAALPIPQARARSRGRGWIELGS
jgi:short-subunit dehydrogenase